MSHHNDEQTLPEGMTPALANALREAELLLMVYGMDHPATIQAMVMVELLAPPDVKAELDARFGKSEPFKVKDLWMSSDVVLTSIASKAGVPPGEVKATIETIIEARQLLGLPTAKLESLVI